MIFSLIPFFAMLTVQFLILLFLLNVISFKVKISFESRNLVLYSALNWKDFQKWLALQLSVTNLKLFDMNHILSNSNFQDEFPHFSAFCYFINHCKNEFCTWACQRSKRWEPLSLSLRLWIFTPYRFSASLYLGFHGITL